MSAEALQQERDLYGIPTTSARASMEKPRNDGWREQVQHLRMHHAEDYGTAAFDEFEPAYRYGWALGNESRYRGRAWPEIESSVRRDWEAHYPDSAWDRFKLAVRRGWERTTDAIERVIPGDSDRDGR